MFQAYQHYFNQRDRKDAAPAKNINLSAVTTMSGGPEAKTGTNASSAHFKNLNASMSGGNQRRSYRPLTTASNVAHVNATQEHTRQNSRTSNSFVAGRGGRGITSAKSIN